MVLPAPDRRLDTWSERVALTAAQVVVVRPEGRSGLSSALSVAPKLPAHAQSKGVNHIADGQSPPIPSALAAVTPSVTTAIPTTAARSDVIDSPPSNHVHASDYGENHELGVYQMMYAALLHVSFVNVVASLPQSRCPRKRSASADEPVKAVDLACLFGPRLT